MSASDEEDDVFVDAEEDQDDEIGTVPSTDSMDDSAMVFDVEPLPLAELYTPAVMADVRRALDLFLSNKFEEAVQMCKARASTSLYHQLGLGVVSAVRAMMTFDRDDLAYAADQLHRTVKFANAYRKQQHGGGVFSSISGLLRGSGHSVSALKAMSPSELHVELIRAEAILIRAGINIANDETFVSVIKGGLQLRGSYMSYKAIHQLIEQTTPASCPTAHDDNMVTGAALGMGGFNMIVSLLPARVLKVVEFFGIPSSRPLGLRLLEEAGHSTGLRAVLCDLFFMAYHLVLVGLLELPPTDLTPVQVALDRNRKRYPEGTLFHYFDAKMQQAKADIPASIRSFLRAVQSQLAWVQLHHLCFWELVWCYLLMQQWDNAALFATRLLNENKWSKSFYAYLCGVAIYEAKGKCDEVNKYFELPAKHKQRIAGKSIPVEKYIIRKARKYGMQGGYLFMPALELVYMCGYSRMLRSRAAEFIVQLDEAEKQLASQTHRYIEDDRCLALLLRGVLLRELDRLDDAEAALSDLLANIDKLVLDHWIAPFGILELVRVHICQKRLRDARTMLATVKGYKHYSMESRLHLRAHVVAQELDDLEAASA